MSKVGIIGDKDTVMGFLALGIDIFPAYSAEEIKKTIHKLAEKEYAIIYITEGASLKAKESLAKGYGIARYYCDPRYRRQHGAGHE